MNFIDYKGDLEINIRYGGIPFAVAKKSDVQGDHLLTTIDQMNIDIVRGVEAMIKMMKKGKFKNYQDFVDKVSKP